VKLNLINPTVRGERVTIIGERGPEWSGLGHTDRLATVLVGYPDGEIGAVRQSDIREEGGRVVAGDSRESADLRG
jgi:hypothetical protein